MQYHPITCEAQEKERSRLLPARVGKVTSHTGRKRELMRSLESYMAPSTTL